MIGVYVRVSTVGQNERGQRAEIRKWLEGNGLADVRYYVDKESGDTLDRPAFQRLQADVFNGTIKTVVVWKLDRLSRSLRDGINTLCDWLASGVRVVSVTQQLDFSGTTGKLIASVLFAVAEMEQQTRRERQAVGIAVAKQEGKYKGRKPGTLKAVPSRARQLRKQGFTDGEIASALTVTRRTVQRYLNG
ncbi:MAG: recombinase family protein [Thermoguttaceae bacterium]